MATGSGAGSGAGAGSGPRRGSFILFEGVDRCGKTTQCRRLVEMLEARGEVAEFMCFPDRTTAIGKIINQYLKKEIELDDHAVHLLFAANRWELAKYIKDSLTAGKHLIVDRYSFSGIAFSAAKPAMGFNWCRAAESGLPAPDVVVYLTLTAEEASKRGGFGTERYEDSAFQKIVRANYARLKSASWEEVDAAGTIEEVGARVQAVVDATIARVADTTIPSLWGTEAVIAPDGEGDAELEASKREAIAAIRGTSQ